MVLEIGHLNTIGECKINRVNTKSKNVQTFLSESNSSSTEQSDGTINNQIQMEISSQNDKSQIEHESKFVEQSLEFIRTVSEKISNIIHLNISDCVVANDVIFKLSMLEC